MNADRGYGDAPFGMAQRTRRIHFIGIGGIGMSGIAEILLNLGYAVTGSDAKASDRTERLARLGAEIFVSHAADNVASADVVVVSSAVSRDNVECQAARAAQIPVIRRAEMLAELMRLKYGIAIAGTHGKTTTTSLVGAVLETAGLAPTVIVGGKLNRYGSGAVQGTGPYLVAEADESDGSFLHLLPTIAVVTNVDQEHMERYPGGLPELSATFANFLSRLPFYGLAVLCADHPEVRALLPGLERRSVSYGLSPQADYRAVELSVSHQETSFELLRRGASLGRVKLPMIGDHNVQNALAAIAVADELSVPVSKCQAALREFEGVDRRFTVRGEVDGVLVVDDYGHHPEEIRVTIAAARAAYPDRRVFAVFQPHRYSRTQAHFDAFVATFFAADQVVVAPIYPAGEAPLAGVDHHALTKALHDQGHQAAEPVSDLAEAERLVVRAARPGDLVICFGAGSIGGMASSLVECLKARGA